MKPLRIPLQPFESLQNSPKTTYPSHPQPVQERLKSLRTSARAPFLPAWGEGESLKNRGDRTAESWVGEALPKFIRVHRERPA